MPWMLDVCSYNKKYAPNMQVCAYNCDLLYYASVGGATRHTVIALSVVLSFCLSVSLSVTPFSRRTLNGEL